MSLVGGIGPHSHGVEHRGDLELTAPRGLGVMLSHLDEASLSSLAKLKNRELRIESLKVRKFDIFKIHLMTTFSDRFLCPVVCQGQLFVPKIGQNSKLFLEKRRLSAPSEVTVVPTELRILRKHDLTLSTSFDSLTAEHQQGSEKPLKYVVNTETGEVKSMPFGMLAKNLSPIPKEADIFGGFFGAVLYPYKDGRVRVKFTGTIVWYSDNGSIECSLAVANTNNSEVRDAAVSPLGDVALLFYDSEIRVYKKGCADVAYALSGSWPVTSDIKWINDESIAVLQKTSVDVYQRDKHIVEEKIPEGYDLALTDLNNGLVLVWPDGMIFIVRGR